MEYNLFWQAILLLVTGMLSVYHGMRWKESEDSIHAFCFGIFIMSSVINLKPFV